MKTQSSSSSSKGPRGRRSGVKVPCDECIQRASQTGTEGNNLELCEKCTAVLNRPRKKQEDQPSNVRRVRRQSHAIIDTALGIHTEQPALPWSDDRQEQHALQFFIRHSAPQLAGYFDSPFWQKMVLVAARHEPAVRHAVAAIGALHEKLLAGVVNPAETTQDKRGRFALEQCNKSIQILIKPREVDGKPNLRLMLTTCVLFTCFEALQGNCEQAIIHASQGYNLLQQYAVDPEDKRWDAGAFAVELDQLTVLMRRLQTQGKGLMGKDFNMASCIQQLALEKPTRFTDLNEARSSLEKVLNQLTVFFLDLELDDQYYDMAITNGEKHLVFAPWLQAWELAFSSLLAQRQPTMNEQERKGAMILKAHHLVAEILSNVDLSLGEMAWDAFHTKFTAIVDLAAALLEDSKRSDASIIDARWKTSGVFISSSNAELSFSLGIVDPLYEVVARCRDPVLRRRALELLATHPRQECMWSSWSAWKVGKFLMRLEEEGSDAPTTSSDIPAERRISEAWLDFSDKSLPAGRGRIGYKRAVPRAAARYALNPGLFDWRTDEPGFIPSLNFATVVTPEGSRSQTQSGYFATSPSTTSPPSVQLTPPEDNERVATWSSFNQ
ncbi:Aspercryptin biosynthesis cluster-specific transcription regulator atnN [Pseudocercospora fuligena]|uniref:Aspercryptin biosynthesis cluster-specific transcription regulator atnN n=1 Tax=Pseudocercospora fuligena TaxID=685502 RepID=A0A8H6R3K2_9PEZI|nr:Aspercryptin biosynthesis cluster-specific transcription regulator atnN [Pseudocercospora fuligena]